MRRVHDVLDQYDKFDTTDRKKIILIELFQKHPGTRFDISEIHEEVGDKMDIGQGRTAQLLRELEEESVLDSHGDQRKAYQMSNEILIPMKYQVIAGLRHLWSIIDIERWGMVNFLVISTILWFFFTLPFWFFSVILFVSPSNRIGPISENEIIILTLSMTIWLVILAILTSFLQMVRRWWNKRFAPDYVNEQEL